jgi:hypothetical protein
MTDVLYVAAIIAFFAVMLGFVYLYGRKAGGPEFDVSGLAAESDVQDAPRPVTG